MEGRSMTKRFREELRVVPKIKIFCYICRRVFGCKNKIDGGQRNECAMHCDSIMYCVAGCVIDNLPAQMQKEATSGICKSCEEKRRTPKRL